MRRARFAMALVAGCLAVASPAASEECGKWFPDLTCDRTGRFEGFEMPIVQPYLFEDPFITTGVYPYYVWHQFPEKSPLQGGEAHVAAAQIRVAITDRFAFIATKDGYMWKDPGNPLLPETGGWMNLAFGAKYAVYQNRDAGQIVSVSLKYEAPSGAEDTYQGEGDGILSPAVSAAARLGPVNLIGDLGGNWAIDSSQSSSIYYHLYAGIPIGKWIQPFVQFSGTSWVDEGDGSQPIGLAKSVQPIFGKSIPVGLVEAVYVDGCNPFGCFNYGPFEGADVVNLGATHAQNLDLFTIAAGVHINVGDLVTVSVAYENSVGKDPGIFDQRVTTAVALEF